MSGFDDNFDVLVEEGVMTQAEVDEMRKARAETAAMRAGLEAQEEISEVPPGLGDFDAIMAEAKAAHAQAEADLEQWDGETAERHRAMRKVAKGGIRVQGLYAARQELPELVHSCQEAYEKCIQGLEDYANGKVTKEEADAQFEEIKTEFGISGEQWEDVKSYSNSLINVKVDQMACVINIGDSGTYRNLYEIEGVTEGYNYACSETEKYWATIEEAHAEYPDYVKENITDPKITHYMFCDDTKCYRIKDDI